MHFDRCSDATALDREKISCLEYMIADSARTQVNATTTSLYDASANGAGSKPQSASASSKLDAAGGEQSVFLSHDFFMAEVEEHWRLPAICSAIAEPGIDNVDLIFCLDDPAPGPIRDFRS